MKIEGAPAIVWASSLDEAPLGRSARILLTHLTDVQMKGAWYGNRRQTVMMKWGGLPCMMRKGTAQVSLKVQPGEWTAFVLASDGTRRDRIPTTAKKGRLLLKLDNARDPNCATYTYELVRESPQS